MYLGKVWCEPCRVVTYNLGATLHRAPKHSGDGLTHSGCINTELDGNVSAVRGNVTYNGGVSEVFLLTWGWMLLSMWREWVSSLARAAVPGRPANHCCCCPCHSLACPSQRTARPRLAETAWPTVAAPIRGPTASLGATLATSPAAGPPATSDCSRSWLRRLGNQRRISPQ